MAVVVWKRLRAGVWWQQMRVILLFLCFFQVSAMVMESHGNSNSSIAFNDQSDPEDNETEMDCIDWKGNPVANGEKYIPPGKNDPCLECWCDNHFPILCKSVACSAPESCVNPRLIADKCCEYKCLPGDSQDNGNGTGIAKDPTQDTEESITNLSLRLIASTVTSLLFLALLLFMVYRLRQRRLLLAMRRYEARSRIFNNEDADSDHYIPDALMSLECPPYTDPPPPYSPPKPPHIYLGEQPPPYDEISLAGNSDGREVERPNQPRRSASGNEITAMTIAMSQAQPVQAVLARSAPEARGHDSPRQTVETLPAYASTDVVQGLDSLLASRTCSFPQNCNDWRADIVATCSECPQDSFYNRSAGLSASSSNHHSFSCPPNSEGHDLGPPVTAFQKFSSLFKRNAPKSKNRHGQARPVSECQPPPQYSTVPRNDYGSNTSTGGYASFINSGRRAQGSSRPITRSLTDRMCFSYDSARAAYELAAMSPSTSSNSSSSGGLVPSCSPRDRDGSRQNPLRSQQFQDDLRRHLPFPQSSDNSEFMAQNSAPPCPSTVSPSGSSMLQTTAYQPGFREDHTQQTCPSTIPGPDQAQEATASIVYDLTGSIAGLTSCPPTPSRVRLQSPDVLEDRQHCASRVPPSEISSSSHHSHVYSLGAAPQQGQDSNSHYSPAENLRNNENKTPSPPVPGGVMRRSQSGVSALSMFSVCSETGEKKLKDGDGEPPENSKVLASDSQYPCHHSLSRSKLGTSSSFQRAEASCLQTASPPRHSEDTNLQLSKSGSSSNRTICPRDEVNVASQDSATFNVSPYHYNRCIEAGVDGDRAVLSQENQIPDGLDGTYFQENDLNQGPRNKPQSSISTPLNIRPTSPFVSAQSGQPIPVSIESPKRRVSAEQETKNVHLESRKIKKKKSGKEKSQAQPSPQHLPIHKSDIKHSTNASSHGNFGSSYSKTDVPFRDSQPRMSTKSRPSKGGERKKRTLSSLAPPLENSASSYVNWLSRPPEDTNVRGYGNADVYRSYGCDATPAPSVLPNEYPSSQGYANNRLIFGNSRENGEIPLGYTFTSPAARSSSHPRTGHGERSSQPPVTKKKGAHKRQASVGDRILNGCNPSQRPRPKSAAGPDRVHAQRFEPESSMAEHSVAVGRGAKSGFGQDMNLDDEMGMIDFFNQGVDYSATKKTGRASGVSNDPNLPTTSRSHSRGITDSVYQQQHGNNRSGLSSDLSFVNGSCPTTAEKGKKRASLPSLPVFSCHSPGVASVGIKNLSGKIEERTGWEDGRHRNSLPDGSHPQATSYV